MKREHEAALAACLLLAAPANAATWTSELPTTGSPCVEWHWRAYDPTGFVFYEVLTATNYATIPEPLMPQKVDCECRDAVGRWSPRSEASLPYFPPALVQQYGRAGMALRVGGLSMTVALIQSVEWVELDSLQKGTER